MTNRAPSNVGLGHLAHLDRAHDASRDADVFQGGLKRQRVDHRGDHADVISGRPIHVQRLGASEDVPSSDHDSGLDVQLDELANLLRKPLDDLGIDAEIVAALEVLTADFQQNPAVLRSWLPAHVSLGDDNLERRRGFSLQPSCV